MIQKENVPTAVITGSTAGIGKAIAISLAKEGFRILLNGRRPKEEVKELLNNLEDVSGGIKQHLYVQGDISSKETKQGIVDLVSQELGGLKVLVNNAGVATKDRKDMLDLNEEEMIELLKINLIAPFMLSQALTPFLIKEKQQSHLINISSISAYTASINRADYCISKAGLSMMTQLFAQRLAESNVRVFEIRPGIIETDMTAEVKDKYTELIDKGLLPIRRWGQPEDIACAVLGIVKGYYPYSTGEVINVDGGFHLRSL
ncbi:3-ketoacyl-ACP reductase [bacterium]|nr:3-ketoacyl-ACP reductase [bacterium]